MAFDKQVFADNIRGYRSKKRMSQAELGAAIGRDQTTIGNYENPNSNSVPDYEDCWKLADVFGVPLSALGERDESMYAKA